MAELQERNHVTAVHDPVKDQLDRILASRHFRNSRRCQTLLSYIVETSGKGQHEQLKERVIGAVVFGRDPAYDTNEDAVVRNAAAEVRKRLAQYYLDPDHENDIRIDLPNGTYFAEFRKPVPHKYVAASATWAVRWGYAVALVLLAGAVAWPIFRSGPKTGGMTELDRFWEPIVKANGVVQICFGQSGRMFYAGKRIDKQTTVPVRELQPLRDRFIYIGDGIALAKIGGYLYSRGKDYNPRGAVITPYAELRGHPIVLIGAFNNPWTVRLTEKLRFSLDQSEDMETRMVLDKQRPGESPWKLNRKGPNWDSEEDYAIVTRLFDPNTEQWVVAAGGISHFGTMMVGEFLANPAYFRAALAAAPADWPRKNMQIVLSTKIVNETPGPPQVLATHFW